ncbi:hypothetical protein OHS70_03640 [Streptomyces sp. NBC_00390]|uniref:hypothetical protein n=1 Tax=Streptomyces sp. NBC_00390 TaxID=2975736 RepID=UPI002E1DD874
MACTGDSICTITVSCPAGKVVTGGGLDSAVLASSGLYVMETQPINDTTWSGTYRNATGITINITVWGVCVDAP